MALTILAAYDVRDDRRRARLAAALQQWGHRVQLSVFICTIDHDGLRVLVEVVERIIDPRQDSFMVLRQCSQSWDRAIVLGQSQPVEKELFWSIV